MTRKHFQVIAELLIEQRAILNLSDKRHGIACGLWADELTKQNSAFNRYLFLKECGVLS